MLGLYANAIWQVLLLGVLIGAGLPALFAVGVRAMAYAEGATAGGTRHPIGKPIAVLCFLLVILGIVLGITIIVASGFGYRVSFENLLPMLVKKH